MCRSRLPTDLGNYTVETSQNASNISGSIHATRRVSKSKKPTALDSFPDETPQNVSNTPGSVHPLGKVSRSRMPPTSGNFPVETPQNVLNTSGSFHTPGEVSGYRMPTASGLFHIETPQNALNTSGQTHTRGKGAIAIHSRSANHKKSGINTRNQVAGAARVTKNRSTMTQEEMNRRCGVSMALDDRETKARRILEDRKKNAEAEIRAMEEKLRERRLDLGAIKARLASGEMSSAVVEGILKSHEQEMPEKAEGQENKYAPGEENMNTKEEDNQNVNG